MANIGAKPEVQIYVDTAEAYTGQWPTTCIGPKNANVSQGVWVEPIRYVVEFEEKDLRKLKNTTSDPFRKLQSNFQWIGDQMNMNVLLFVGHIESCDLHIQTIDEKLRRGEVLFTNNLPTLFLIIACHGDELAFEANIGKMSFSDAKIFTFGFLNLVHIYNGDIYSCEEPHLKIPDMACDYDGSKADKEKLFNNTGKLNQSKYNATNDPNKLAKCCEAKFARFSHIFVDYLNKRKCGKFTKEKLLEKFRSIFPEGEPLREVYSLTREESTLTNDNAVRCTPEGSCAIENPFSFTNARIYNEQRILTKKYEEILVGVAPSVVAKLANESAVNKSEPLDGKVLVEKLNRLGKDREAVVNYFYPGLGNLLQMVCYYAYAQYNHSVLIKELIRYTKDLKALDAFGNSAIANLIFNRSFFPDFEPILYDLLNTFMKKDFESLFTFSGEGHTPLYDAISDQNTMVIYFYLKKFPEIELDMQNSNYYGDTCLHLLSKQMPSTYYDSPRYLGGKDLTVTTKEFRENFYRKIQNITNDYTYAENMLQIFLALGASPDRIGEDRLLPEDTFFPVVNEYNYINELIRTPLPISEKIISLLTIYGNLASHDTYIKRQLAFYSSVLYGTDPYESNNNNNDRYSNYGNYSPYGGGRQKQKGGAIARPEVIQKLREELDKVIHELTDKSVSRQQINHYIYFRDNIEDLFYHAYNVFKFCQTISELLPRERGPLLHPEIVAQEISQVTDELDAPETTKETFALLDTFLKGTYASKIPKNFKGQIRQESLVLMKNTTKTGLEKAKAMQALFMDVVGKALLIAVSNAQERRTITNEKARNAVVSGRNIMNNKDKSPAQKLKDITALIQTFTPAPVAGPTKGGQTRKVNHKRSVKKQTRRRH